MTNNEENNKIKTTEEYSKERAEQMCSTYMKAYKLNCNENLKKSVEDCKKELTKEEASEAISIGEAAFNLLFKESGDKSSTYMQLYGPKKPHTLIATREEAKRFRGLEPTITIIEEEYDETL